MTHIICDMHVSSMAYFQRNMHLTFLILENFKIELKIEFMEKY